MPLSAWIAIAAAALLVAVLLARRKVPGRSPVLVLIPLAILVLSLDHAIPKTATTQLAATALILAAALASILWILWRLPRDPKVRPAALAPPLFPLIAVLPPAMEHFLPRAARLLDWSAATVAAIGLTIIWDALRRWYDDDAPRPRLVATLAAGGAAVIYGGLLLPPGAAAAWVLIPIGLGVATAIALTLRAYWIE